MKSFIIGWLCLFTLSASAQKSASTLVQEINATIQQYSADIKTPFHLFETIGTIEQAQNTFSSLRMKPGELQSIDVKPSALGFTVSIQCGENGHCLNLLKYDTLTTPMPSTAFFFTEASAANAFALALRDLGKALNKEAIPVKLDLIKDNNTNEKQILPAAKSNTKATAQKHNDDDDDINEPEEPVSKAPVTHAPHTVKTKAKVEEEDKDAEDAEPVKKTSRATTKTKTAKDDEDVVEKEEQASTRAASSDNLPTEPICRQLLSIIQSGKQSGFKDIEGKETNTEKKINESKLKLRGAKRNYLSWYRNKRAFLAEYKTSNDNELIIEEFGKLQTELEDCLEGSWEDTDHSSDDMYANSKEEVKDVEYVSTADPSAPHLRILIHSEGERHTLFIRIQ